MSRRKIKNPARKPKTPKIPEISLKNAAYSHLTMSREQRKSKDEEIVAGLIDDEKLDVEQRHDYQYMSLIARDIGWKPNRLQKTLDRMVTRMKAIESAIKRAQKEKKDEEENQEGESKAAEG